MKKFLLSALAALTMSTVALADSVTYPEDSTTGWTAYTFSSQSESSNDLVGTVGQFTFTLAKGTAGTNPLAPDASSIRIYQGATLTIEAPAGCTMTEVSGLTASNSKATSTTVSDGWTNETGTIKAAANQAFKFTCSGLNTITFSGNNAQLRVKQITITYTNGTAPAVASPKVSCENNTVTITATDADDVYYTLDGTEPTNASTKYTAPFAITETTTVKAIAYKGTEKSLVTTYTANYVGTYADFAAFIAANTTGTVAGPIYVLYQSADQRYLYLKDGNNNFMLSYGKVGDNTFVNGDVLASITGKYSPYSKLPEMIPTAFGEKTSGTAIAPEELTAEELSVDMANAYIVLKDVEISGVSGKNFSIKDATATIAGYNTIGLTEIPEGTGFTLTGFVSRYNDNLQVTPISIVGGTVVETVATPTFSVTAGAVEEGTKVTISCTTEGASIFYTTDETTPTAASTQYNGEEIVINTATTIKAIAIKEGMNDSDVATAAYTILDKNATIATFDFGKPGELSPAVEEPAASAGTDIAGMTFTNNAVSLKIGESTEQNKPRIWKMSGGDNDFRMYKNDSFTISVSSDYKITAIDFTSLKASTYNFGTETGTFTTDGKNAAWAPASESDKTQSVTFTAPSDATTSRIATITVTYTSINSAVESIEIDNANAPVEYYNLQGVRVANPTAGNLYIVRQGNKVSKTIIR